LLDVRTPCLSIAAALALTATLVATAQAASTNVVTVIKTQDALVRRMPDYKTFNENLNVKTVAAAKKVVPIIAPFEKASARATHIVAQASASSAKQRQGKADWVKGSNEADRGILEYLAALKDLIAGNHAAFQTGDAKAQKLIANGVTLGAKGDRLLGISINE
jgi:hypothetical protein